MAYTPHTPQDIREMLEVIGVEKIEDLFEQIPEDLRLRRDLDFPAPLSEAELSRDLDDRAKKVTSLDEQISFMGAGAYDHYVPALVDALSLRGEYFSAYTPYQAEASQGNLQVFYEFQTHICRLTGLEVANASLYDGASAVAEAIIMAMNLKRRRSKVLLASTLHPEYLEVVETYFKNLDDVEFFHLPAQKGRIDLEALKGHLDDDTCCVVYQTPNFYGSLEEGQKICRLTEEAGALAIAAIADPFSLSMISTPGEDGAHIACGEAQSLGNPLSLGGPSLGFLATKEAFIRKIPGRIVGETVDVEGRRAYVLTLQTREQHIRREKATSNICTNQALLALRTTIYLGAMGQEGFRELGELCYHRAHYLARKISEIKGYDLAFRHPFFREFTVRCPRPASEVIDKLSREGILPGVDLGRFQGEMENCLLVAVTEKNSREELDRLIGALAHL